MGAAELVTVILLTQASGGASQDSIIFHKYNNVCFKRNSF